MRLFLVFFVFTLSASYARAEHLSISAELQDADNASHLIHFLQCLSEEQISWDLIQNTDSSNPTLQLRENGAKLVATLINTQQNSSKVLEKNDLTAYCKEVANILQKKITLSPPEIKNSGQSLPAEFYLAEKPKTYWEKNWLPISALVILGSIFIYAKTKAPSVTGVIISP